MKAFLVYNFQPIRILLAYTWVLMLLFFFSSCQSNKADYSLSDDEFAIVLADLHLAENLAQNATGKTKDSLSRHFFGEVYKIHQLDSLEVERNIELLKNDPKKLAVVYEKVLEVLKKKEAKNN